MKKNLSVLFFVTTSQENLYLILLSVTCIMKTIDMYSFRKLDMILILFL